MPDDAKAYVEALELPALEESVKEAAAAAPPVEYDNLKDQGVVVGSDIVSFQKGVTEQRRKDIVNSALLAQLAANQAVSKDADPLQWYGAYFDTLSNIGWVQQARQFAEHKESSQTFEAHQAILSVAEMLLGPATTAFQLVKKTLDALRETGNGSPMLTVFDSESQSSNTARFQVTLAEAAPDGGFLVKLMAFTLDAKTTMDQVFFFKSTTNDVTFKHASGAVTVNEDVLDGVRDAIAKRLADYAAAYVKSIPDLKIPAPGAAASATQV